MRHTEENILSLLAGTNPSDLSADQLDMVQEWKSDSTDNENLFEALAFIEANKTDFANYKTISEQKTRTNLPKLIALVIILALSFFTMVQMGWINFVPKTEAVQIAFLDDQTEIHLMSGATLKKAEGFNQTNRIVYLEGDAFFDVSHNENLPFIIEQHQDKIEVLGTSFQVKRQAEGLHVSVYDGKVKLINEEGIFRYLVEGESALAHQNAVDKTTVFIDNPTLVTKSYKDEKVHDILLDLKVSFNFDISFNENIRNASCRYNGSFEKASLTEILEEFSMIFDMEYHIENHEIVIDSLSCS